MKCPMRAERYFHAGGDDSFIHTFDELLLFSIGNE